MMSKSSAHSRAVDLRADGQVRATDPLSGFRPEMVDVAPTLEEALRQVYLSRDNR